MVSPFCFWGWRTPPFKIAVEGLSSPPFGLGVTHPPIFKIVRDQPRYGTESYHGTAGSCTAGSCYRKLLQEAATGSCAEALLQEAARRRCCDDGHQSGTTAGSCTLHDCRKLQEQRGQREAAAAAAKSNKVNRKQQLRTTRYRNAASLHFSHFRAAHTLHSSSSANVRPLRTAAHQPYTIVIHSHATPFYDLAIL
jgi:hypothetical protein